MNILMNRIRNDAYAMLFVVAAVVCLVLSIVTPLHAVFFIGTVAFLLILIAYLWSVMGTESILYDNTPQSAATPITEEVVQTVRPVTTTEEVVQTVSPVIATEVVASPDVLTEEVVQTAEPETSTEEVVQTAEPETSTEEVVQRTESITQEAPKETPQAAE